MISRLNQLGCTLHFMCLPCHVCAFAALHNNVLWFIAKTAALLQDNVYIKDTSAPEVFFFPVFFFLFLIIWKQVYWSMATYITPTLAAVVLCPELLFLTRTGQQLDSSLSFPNLCCYFLPLHPSLCLSLTPNMYTHCRQKVHAQSHSHTHLHADACTFTMKSF